MKKNDCVSLTADNLGSELEGICRYEGMPVFVPGLLPGETATVRIVKTEKRYAFGRMESAPNPVSSARKKPDCSAWPRCGGCSGRHMKYETTLEAKRLQVQDCFERESRISGFLFRPLWEWMPLPDTETRPRCLPEEPQSSRFWAFTLRAVTPSSPLTSARTPCRLPMKLLPYFWGG